MSESSAEATDRARSILPANHGGTDDRWGSLLRFVLGAAWMFLSFAAARALVHFLIVPYAALVQQVVALGLLVAGFWSFSFTLDRERAPMNAIGFTRRKTAWREFALGLALGWGMVAVLVLPMMLAGRLNPTFFWGGYAWKLLAGNLLLLAVGVLAEETAFRGYPYQRLIHAMGDAWGTVLMAVVFGLVHLQNSYASLSSTLVAMLGGVLFSVAYLRTRALWLPWGLHLGWNASLGLIFGLPVGGDGTFSSVVQSVAGGPRWLTGLEYGPEGSALAGIVLLVGIGVLAWVTRDYAWTYNAPVIVGMGYPMDVAPPQEHTRMEETAAKANALVQILPSTPQEFSKPKGS